MLSDKSVENIAKLLYGSLDNLMFATCGEYELSAEDFEILLYRSVEDVIHNQLGIPGVDISQELFDRIVSELVKNYTS